MPSGLADPTKASFTQNTNGEGTAVKADSGDVYDNAGNKASAQSAGFKVDKAAPVISRDAVKNGTLGNNGWYTSDVRYGFTASDGASGSSSQQKDRGIRPGPSLIEGTGQMI